jgi:hypothetical protein
VPLDLLQGAGARSEGGHERRAGKEKPDRIEFAIREPALSLEIRPPIMRNPRWDVCSCALNISAV